MTTSNTLTKTDLTNILNEIVAIDGTDMTLQEIDDFVASLNVMGINAVDYIVEEDGNSNWKWRKWNSGKVEAWGFYTASAKTGSSWVSPLYYTDESVTFPSGLFNVAPSYIIATSHNSQWCVWANWLISTSGCTLRHIKPNANSMAIDTHIYVIGTWK